MTSPYGFQMNVRQYSPLRSSGAVVDSGRVKYKDLETVTSSHCLHARAGWNDVSAHQARADWNVKKVLL